MKLLIDDARVDAIKDYFRHPEGFVNADVADLLTDRRTMLARIAELEKERDRLREFEPQLVSFESNEFAITVARNTMARLVEAFASLNGEANYTVTTFQSQDTGGTFEVVVREQGKPSEHDMRKRAEARCAELEAQLDAMRAAASELFGG